MLTETQKLRAELDAANAILRGRGRRLDNLEALLKAALPYVLRHAEMFRGLELGAEHKNEAEALAERIMDMVHSC